MLGVNNKEGYHQQNVDDEVDLEENIDDVVHARVRHSFNRDSVAGTKKIIDDVFLRAKWATL